MSSTYIEEGLSPDVKDFHRAVVSLQEELEALDWYSQRIDITTDEELKAILAHHRDEEIEHALMLLEWMRRRSAKVNAEARTYLFTSLPVTEVEEEEEKSGSSETASAGMKQFLGLGIGKLAGDKS